MKNVFDASKNTIFVDLDGVLADFDGFVFNKLGRPFVLMDGPSADQEMWDYLTTVDRLYLQLELLPRALELWEVVNSFGARVEILTAVPKRAVIPTAAEDKREWVKMHIGENTPFRIGPYSANKWQHARPGDVLIDDRQDNIRDWINKGFGIGIHHSDIDATLQCLERVIRAV